MWRAEGRTMPKSSATRDHFERTAAFWRDVYGSPGVEGAVYAERQRKALALVDGLGLGPGAMAIEIGCGAGWNTAAPAERGFRVQAADPVEKMLRMTREMAAARRVQELVGVICCMGEALPFAGESFDVAVGIAVMEWADSPQSMLGELLRVLRPGGYLILSATNRWSLQRVMDPWFNPLWAPLKNWMRQQAHAGNTAHARTHSFRGPSPVAKTSGWLRSESGTRPDVARAAVPPASIAESLPIPLPRSLPPRRSFRRQRAALLPCNRSHPPIPEPSGPRPSRASCAASFPPGRPPVPGTRVPPAQPYSNPPRSRSRWPSRRVPGPGHPPAPALSAPARHTPRPPRPASRRRPARTPLSARNDHALLRTSALSCSPLAASAGIKSRIGRMSSWPASRRLAARSKIRRNPPSIASVRHVRSVGWNQR